MKEQEKKQQKDLIHEKWLANPLRCGVWNCLAPTTIIEEDEQWVWVRCEVHRAKTLHQKRKETPPPKIMKPAWSLDIRELIKKQK